MKAPPEGPLKINFTELAPRFARFGRDRWQTGGIARLFRGSAIEERPKMNLVMPKCEVNLERALRALQHAHECDPDGLSTDSAGFLGREEGDHLGYFLRCGHATRRIQCRPFLPDLTGRDTPVLRLLAG